MSYDIIYDKQFVRLNNGEIIPFILIGSSNCYEITYKGQRRERSWQVLTYYYTDKGKISIKPNEFINNIENYINSIAERYKEDAGNKEEVLKRLGYYTGIAIYGGHPIDTNYKKFIGFFKNGIKKSLTIKELAEIGVYIKTSYYISYQAEQEKIDKNIKNTLPENKICQTEEDLYKAIEEYEKWKNQYPQYIEYVFFYLTFQGYWENVLGRLKNYRRENKNKREKKTIMQDYYFILYSNQYGALVKYTKKGFRYSYGYNGKKFRTFKEAERYLKKIKEKQYYKADIWEIKRIDKPITFLV